MSHIAMVSVPAHGHVNPNLAVVRELVKRGHRVTYAVGDSFADQVADTGATVVRYRTTLGRRPEADGGGNTREAGATFSRLLEEAIAALPQLRAVYEPAPPDLFLYDIAAFCAPLLAATWKVPVVQLSPSFVAWQGHEQDAAAEIEALRGSPSGAAFYTQFADWLAENGAETTVDDYLRRPARCIVMIPRSLQPFAEKVADSFTFVGPCFDDRSAQGEWQPPAGDPRVLLVSLGTVYTDRADFYAECLTAFGNLDGWHVVLSVGGTIDPASLGPLPSNVEVHQHVAQMSVLSRAHAFVTHGGMSSIMESLYHGVPMVVVPQAVDQFANAARIAELGAGRHLPAEQANSQRLREAVLEVAADAETADRMARLRDDLRSAGGTQAAADVIEARLSVD